MTAHEIPGSVRLIVIRQDGERVVILEKTTMGKARAAAGILKKYCPADAFLIDVISYGYDALPL
jgi:hypothetical protein